MMKDLKLGIQCMRYGHSRRMLFALAIFMMIFGALSIITNVDMRLMTYVIGGYLMTVAPCMSVSIYQTINMSKFALSSPKQKRMVVQITTMLIGISLLIGFILFTIVMLILIANNRCIVEEIGYIYIVLGILDVIIIIYIAFSYKYFFLSTVVFVIGYVTIYVICSSVMDSFKNSISISSGMSIALVCIMVSSFIYLGISKLTYKTPMDKYAVGSLLRRELN